MRAYKTFEDSRPIELGEVTKDQIASLIDEIDPALTGNNPLGIGFCRSEEDFIEITPVGNSQYLIWSDCIAGTKGFLSKLFRQSPIQTTVKSLDDAIEAVIYFWDCSREEFEQKYR